MNPTAGQILTDATEVLLAPTSDDAAETRAAREAYPGLDLSEYGLAEQLAGAPILWQRYHDAQYASPVFRAVVETAVDWARVGLYRPIPRQELRDLARARLDRTHRALDITDDALASAEQEARTPPRDVQGKPTGKVAFLQVAEKSEQGRTYQPYPYLVAADDGQRGDPRDIPPWFWDQAVHRADPDDASEIGISADPAGLDRFPEWRNLPQGQRNVTTLP